MKDFKLLGIIFVLLALCSLSSYAGNNDRAGEAGSSQLLINPWVKSVGFGGANTASITGLEAMAMNVAGMAFTPKTEVMFANKNWLVGSGININSFGLSQRIGETGVIGLSAMSVSYGDIQVTTTSLPEGGIGDFSPTNLIIDFGYAKTFSNSISGGFTVRIISESISNISSRGVAFDAGIRYVTGENDQVKFGIALKNVGPTIKPSGDGLSFSDETDVTGVSITSSVDRRVAAYQLPSLLNIGFAYDFYLSPQKDSTSGEIKTLHRLTAAGNFSANSFTNDQYRFGLEYAFKELFMVRGGYVLESDVWFDSSQRVNAYTGPSFGASLVAPLGKKGTTFGVHYAYQLTERFDGTHSIGVKLNL